MFTPRADVTVDFEAFLKSFFAESRFFFDEDLYFFVELRFFLDVCFYLRDFSCLLAELNIFYFYFKWLLNLFFTSISLLCALLLLPLC